MLTRPTRRPEDLVLRSTVLSVFAADDQLSDRGLRVGVQNGYAHLGGRLPTLELRARTATLVAAIPGVQGVVNRIMAPGAPSPVRAVDLCVPNTNQDSSAPRT